MRTAGTNNGVSRGWHILKRNPGYIEEWRASAEAVP